jgi:RimJ/RimL family protein N-acetyltransferase
LGGRVTHTPVTWPRRTPVLVLRPMTAEDVAPLLAWRNHPAVSRWLLRTTTDEASLRESLRTPDPDDHSCVAEHEGRLVAAGYLEVRDGMGQDVGDAHHGAEALLGWNVAPQWWGRGFATQVAGTLLDIAFGDLGLHRVTAGCFADNTGSWRVMEKVGMRREQHGVKDSWHAELGWVDGYTYAMLGEEWVARRRHVG